MSMNTVNIVKASTDATVRLFDDFYFFEADVPAVEYDAVFSFFRSIFEAKDTAGAFTLNLFRISQSTGIDVITLMTEMQSQNAIELNATMAYYLNNIRSPSTLLGVGSMATPNYWTARNVVA
jgi:hypothetical protein